MKENLIMIPGTLCDDLLFDHQIKAFEYFANCIVADHSSADDLKKLVHNILKSVAGALQISFVSIVWVPAATTQRR